MKKPFVHIAVLAAIYLGGLFGLSLVSPGSGGSAVWPPTGIALAAVLLCGYRIWPVVALATFLISIHAGMNVSASIGVAAGNALEAILGAFLIERFAQGIKAFHQAGSIFRFILSTAFSTAVSAAAGALTICWLRHISWRSFPELWTTWWVGNYTSDLILTPVLLIWADPGCRPGGKRRGEAVCLFFILIAFSQAVFGGWFSNSIEGYPLEYLTIPLLLWAALRFGLCAASSAALVLWGIAVEGTSRGFGPFTGGGQIESFLLLQTFLATVSQTALVVAAILTERQRVETALRQSEIQLRFVWENSIDGMRLLNEDGIMLAVNEAYCQLMEQSRESLQGQSIAVLYPEDRREEMVRQHREDFRQHTFTPHVEKQMMLSGGRKIYLELSNSLLDLEGRQPLLLSVFRNITERKTTEKTLREIPGQILQAQESERMRVARELHDSVNQILSATKFRLDSVEETSAATENLTKARELLNKAMHEVWRISRNLRPSELDDLGLAPAVRSLCYEFEHRTGISVDLNLAQPLVLPPGIELTLYRIVQEALTNVEKHAEATEVKLALTLKAPWLLLHIEDNGVGLQSSAGRRKSGMGLVGMQERVAYAGGTVEVKSMPARGTRIEVNLPAQIEGTETP